MNGRDTTHPTKVQYRMIYIVRGTQSNPVIHKVFGVLSEAMCYLHAIGGTPNVVDEWPVEFLVSGDKQLTQRPTLGRR